MDIKGKTIICPQCGAPYQVQEVQRDARCDYCGTYLLEVYERWLEEERNRSQNKAREEKEKADLERARLEAKEKAKINRKKRMKELAKPLAVLLKILSSILSIFESIFNILEKAVKTVSTVFLSGLAIIYAVIGLAAILAVFWFLSGIMRIFR